MLKERFLAAGLIILKKIFLSLGFAACYQRDARILSEATPKEK